MGGILLPNNLKVSGAGNLFDEAATLRRALQSELPKILDQFQWLVAKIKAKCLRERP